jgi:hypothetical protein
MKTCFSFLAISLCLIKVTGRIFSHDEYLERLGSKGPYIPPKDLSLAIDSGCEPILVTGIARHGSRNPGKSDLKSYKRMKDLFSDVSVNYSPEYQWLRSWESVYDTRAIHDLVNAGLEEHFGIGERLRSRFPSLFGSYNFRKHKFQSSHMERAAR